MALARDFYTQVKGRNISKDKRVRSIELVDIECVLGDVSGVQILPLYKSAILDVAYIVFIAKNPGAS